MLRYFRYTTIRNKANRVFSDYRHQKNRKRLINHDFTIICSNCNGGVILHDLGLQFDTPTINLYFEPADYLKFCMNLSFYLKQPVNDITGNADYPIGLLNDIKLHFLHYQSFEEARSKWEERSKRVHLDNIYFMFSDRNGCTYEQLKEFDRLPLKNKVVFTNRHYPELKSSKYIRGFEDGNCVGVLSNYRSFFWDKRYYDDFDYVSWLNG